MLVEDVVVVGPRDLTGLLVYSCTGEHPLQYASDL
jgi:hypothetical protein